LLKEVNVVSVEESMLKMKENGIKRLIVAYKDSAIGRGVLSFSFEEGKFIRTISLQNNPRLTFTSPIDFQRGFEILQKIVKGVYSVQASFLVSDPELERDVQNVRKEVVLNG
jgi:hypothetical protein